MGLHPNNAWDSLYFTSIMKELAVRCQFTNPTQCTGQGKRSEECSRLVNSKECIPMAEIMRDARYSLVEQHILYVEPDAEAHAKRYRAMASKTIDHSKSTANKYTTIVKSESNSGDTNSGTNSGGTNGGAGENIGTMNNAAAYSGAANNGAVNTGALMNGEGGYSNNGMNWMGNQIMGMYNPMMRMNQMTGMYNLIMGMNPMMGMNPIMNGMIGMMNPWMYGMAAMGGMMNGGMNALDGWIVGTKSIYEKKKEEN